MIRELMIENYRAFPYFRLSGLARVNLLVGKNGCGKSTILEAIDFLFSPANLRSVALSMRRRGEVLSTPRSEHELTIDAKHLVHGRRSIDELDEGGSFFIGAERERGGLSLQGQITRYSGDLYSSSSGEYDQDEYSSSSEDEETSVSPSSETYLHLAWLSSIANASRPITFEVDSDGGVEIDLRRMPSAQFGHEFSISPCVSIPTAALTAREMVALFNEIVLTRTEDLALSSLQLIHAGIKRVATTGSAQIEVLLDSQKVPLGSLGDGIWRSFGIAVSLAKARGGILLVDEIDTGLHYSVLEQVWSLIYQTARELDVQVFATTHSRDCYESLAKLIQKTQSSECEFSIQRIERGNEHSIAFSQEEILIAAERGIEVR